MEFREHELIWDDIRVKRFWRFMERSVAHESNYFTFHAGPGILRFLRKRTCFSGRVLDYGAGKGFLLKVLMNEKGVEVFGVEFTEESVAALNLILKGRNRAGCCFEVGKIPQELRGTFDWVLLVETLEHLTKAQTTETLVTIYSLLRPMGKVFVTVPRSEDLDRHKTQCPDCGAIYHIMQHQRSFDQPALTRLMEEYGFQSLLCEPVNFDMYRRTQVYYLYRLSRILMPWRVDFCPNLVYIGTTGAA